MVRNYWKAKSWLLVLALSFLILSPAGAQESLSFFFVKITDAS
ncbi:iron permease, partial [Streptococcus pneumoniae]|nr:iron permease [Streptococcus pneumoniae]